MEHLAKEVAQQVPSLAVLAYVVWMFLRQLDRIGEVMKEVGEQNRSAREKQNEVIMENTRVMSQNTEMLRSFELELRRFMGGHPSNEH